MAKFTPEVTSRLGWYVYRLIDPSSGETFYVGKGKDNRVFDHAENKLKPGKNEDTADLKTKRIQRIINTGMKVQHIIHRHGIKDEKTALIVEQALMDAYPGLTNAIAGYGSNEFGCMHAKEIIKKYGAPVAIFHQKTILISIGGSFSKGDRSVYDCVRGVWRMNQDRAQKYRLILAHDRGLIVGAFQACRWLKATRKNFDWLPEDIEGRIGFEGIEAENKEQYLDKRIPDTLRLQGASNPIRYVEPNAKES